MTRRESGKIVLGLALLGVGLLGFSIHVVGRSGPTIYDCITGSYTSECRYGR